MVKFLLNSFYLILGWNCDNVFVRDAGRYMVYGESYIHAEGGQLWLYGLVMLIPCLGVLIVGIQNVLDWEVLPNCYVAASGEEESSEDIILVVLQVTVIISYNL